MNKVVIIINGTGGVGKDTLCDFAGELYYTVNVSSITPIKEIAEKYGYNGIKDEKSRKFLSDLKHAFTEFNDLPFKYLISEYNKFVHDNNNIMFVHIREPEEIARFKDYVSKPCVTLLVRRPNSSKAPWGNNSDANVENYEYDYYYDNNKSIAEVRVDFKDFITDILVDVFGSDAQFDD